MITPLIAAEDFARQLPLDEFELLAERSASTRRVSVCCVRIDDVARMRATLGSPRVEALQRELAMFIRRILRGTDVLTVRGDEILLLLDAASSVALPVAERAIRGVRGHVFRGGGSDEHVRLTVSMGIASSPEHGASWRALHAAASQSLGSVEEDGAAVAFAGDAGLNLSRIMGRGDRLTTLIDTFDAVVRGAGHVVAIMGEAGVGASTLVRTLEPEVRLRGGSLVTGTCHERRLPSPYSLWSDVLRAVRRLPVKTTRQWRDLPLLDGSLEQAEDSLLSGGSKTRLLEEVADFFRLAAQQRPLVLLLEDMQWCDAASWDALEFLIAQLERERIMIVLTIQSGAVGDEALERWRRIASHTRHVEVRLSFLTRDDVKRWLEATLRTPEIGREVMSYVYRQSEGRPLGLTHLLRDLEESGHVVHDGSEWHWSGAHELPQASSFDDLIARRLARLPAGAREIVEIASVLLRDGDETFLAGESASRRRPDLRALVDAGFLRPTYDRSHAAYVVAHTDIARIVRSRLTPAQAADLHLRVARRLARDAVRNASEIAEHFEDAGSNILAYRYALEAANHAASLHEAAAIPALLATAERNAPDEGARAEVRVRMVASAEAAGQYEEAAALCDLALGWYESHNDLLNSLRLKRTRSQIRLKLGQGATETLNELLALEAEANAAGIDMERAAVLLLIAQLHYRLGDTAQAQRIAAEVVEIAERGDDLELLSDASNRLAVTIQLANPAQARAMFTHCLEIATRTGDTGRLVRALNNLGVLEMININFEESKGALTKAVELAKTAGLIEWWGRAELNRGVLTARMGDSAAAAASFNEALRLASMAQSSEEQLHATLNLASLERLNERYREGADLYSLVTDLAVRIGQATINAHAIAGLGLCQLRLGNREGAREALVRATALCEIIGEMFQGRELVDALQIHFMIEQGRFDEAVEEFQRSLRLAEQVDASGAAFLCIEFAEVLRPHGEQIVVAAVGKYADLPDVRLNSKMQERFAVLKRDSSEPS